MFTLSPIIMTKGVYKTSRWIQSKMIIFPPTFSSDPSPTSPEDWGEGEGMGYMKKKLLTLGMVLKRNLMEFCSKARWVGPG